MCFSFSHHREPSSTATQPSQVTPFATYMYCIVYNCSVSTTWDKQLSVDLWCLLVEDRLWSVTESNQNHELHIPGAMCRASQRLVYCNLYQYITTSYFIMPSDWHLLARPSCSRPVGNRYSSTCVSLIHPAEGSAIIKAVSDDSDAPVRHP